MDDAPALSARIVPTPVKNNAGSIAWVLLSVAALGLGGFLLSGSEDARIAGIVFVVLGLLALAIGVYLLRARAANRATLTLTGNMFTFSRPGRPARDIDCTEITNLVLDEKTESSNGTPIGVLRKVRIDGGGAPITFRHLADSKVDDVGFLLGTLVTKIADQASADIARGQEFRGAGWTLNSDGILVAKSQSRVPLTDITAVGIFDRSVALWRERDEEPFASIPAGSANAQVLLELGGRAAADHEARGTGLRREDTEEGLGRLLFRKRTRRLWWMLAIMGGLVFLASSVALGFALEDESALITAVVCGALGIVCLYFGLASRRRAFSCHERGVALRTLLADRRLLYREIAVYQTNSTRQYYNGLYIGTHLTLKLTPETKGKPISFTTQTQGDDDDLEDMRDRIAMAVADRLYERVLQDETVEWGKSARIDRTTIHGFAPKLLGKGKPVEIQIDGELRYLIDDGTFSLLPPDGDKPILKITCADPNFFPGFHLFLRLVEEKEEPASTVGSLAHFRNGAR